jgi:Holliday junction resolvase RusA-like endonuclease
MGAMNNLTPVWTCFVPGEPVGRREKIIKRGGFHSLADTGDRRDYKAYFKAFVATKAPTALLDGPLFLRVRAYRIKPKSARKRDIYPTTKPDITNYVKLIEDCLSGIIIRDDALIVGQDNLKCYAGEQTPPGVEITILREATA